MKCRWSISLLMEKGSKLIREYYTESKNEETLGPFLHPDEREEPCNLTICQMFFLLNVSFFFHTFFSIKFDLHII